MSLSVLSLSMVGLGDFLWLTKATSVTVLPTILTAIFLAFCSETSCHVGSCSTQSLMWQETVASGHQLTSAQICSSHTHSDIFCPVQLFHDAMALIGISFAALWQPSRGGGHRSLTYREWDGKCAPLSHWVWSNSSVTRSPSAPFSSSWVTFVRFALDPRNCQTWPILYVFLEFFPLCESSTLKNLEQFCLPSLSVSPLVALFTYYFSSWNQTAWVSQDLTSLRLKGTRFRI